MDPGQATAAFEALLVRITALETTVNQDAAARFEHLARRMTSVEAVAGAAAPAGQLGHRMAALEQIYARLQQQGPSEAAPRRPTLQLRRSRDLLPAPWASDGSCKDLEFALHS